MSAYVLGVTQYQAFSDVIDSVSYNYDSSFYGPGPTTGTVTAPLAQSIYRYTDVLINGPYDGTSVCGARTYTTNCAYLTVGREW